MERPLYGIDPRAIAVRTLMVGFVAALAFGFYAMHNGENDEKTQQTPTPSPVSRNINSFENPSNSDIQLTLTPQP